MLLSTIGYRLLGRSDGTLSPDTLSWLLRNGSRFRLPFTSADIRRANEWRIRWFGAERGQ